MIEKPVARLDITLTVDSATLITKSQVGGSQDNSDGVDSDSIGRLMQLVHMVHDGRNDCDSEVDMYPIMFNT